MAKILGTKPADRNRRFTVSSAEAEDDRPAMSLFDPQAGTILVPSTKGAL